MNINNQQRFQYFLKQSIKTIQSTNSIRYFPIKYRSDSPLRFNEFYFSLNHRVAKPKNKIRIKFEINNCRQKLSKDRF